MMYCELEICRMYFIEEFVVELIRFVFQKSSYLQLHFGSPSNLNGCSSIAKGV